jgi:hypothetical protein
MRRLALAAAAVAAAQETSNCDCYRTNGSTPAYFVEHAFYDYRNASAQDRTSPTALTTPGELANQNATSPFFLSSAWRDVWATQTWNNSETLNSSGASVLMINSANNVYLGECPACWAQS